MEWIVAVFMCVFGVVIGSFLNVCIYRIPKNISVAKGRSICPGCNSTIKGYDNIPIFSFLFLRGKCRNCSCKISPRYPLVELLGGLTFLLVGYEFSLSYATLIYCIFASVLICVAFIDIDTQEIPDRFHLIILGLAIASFFLVPEILWYERLIGAVAVSVPMFVIALVTGGMGMGDVKLMAVSGLLIGWQAILFGGILGAVLAAFIGVLLIATKRKSRKDKIAFGPYLAIALFVSALYGNEIINWYLSLFMF